MRTSIVSSSLSQADASAPIAAPLRLRHIDSLRAVAAGTVMWTHFAESLQPVSAAGPAFLSFLVTLPPFMNLGRVGVVIFFAISGFVICRSFGGPREGGTRRFLIRRFCRLYPAFWASMLGAVVVWWLQHKGLTWPLVLSTVTMIPNLLGQPFMLGVYWTLEIELVFYALCLALYRLGWLDRRGVLGGCALVFAVTPRTVRRLGKYLGVPLTLPGEGDTWMISLAVMCWGALFRLVYDETGGFRRRGTLTHAGTWVLVLFTLALVDLHDPNFKRLLWNGAGASLRLDQMGSFVAMAVFLLWVACLRVDNRPLTFLGVISYSLYLSHPLVMQVVRPVIVATEEHGWPAPPLWAGMAVCAALTVAVSAVTYSWIEQPAIALGKRWVGRWEKKPSVGTGGTTTAA